MQSSIRSLISAGHSSGTCIGRAQIVDEECLHLGCQCPYKLPAKLKRSCSPLWSSAPSVTDQDSQQLTPGLLGALGFPCSIQMCKIDESSKCMFTCRGRSWPLRGASLQARGAQSALTSPDMVEQRWQAGLHAQQQQQAFLHLARDRVT